MNAEIHINFLEPVGKQPRDWSQFVMRCYYLDADGYLQKRVYTPQDIPVAHMPALQAVTAAIVGLAQPWTATQVIARYASAWVEPDPPTEGNTQFEPYISEWVELEVSAESDTGGSRVFTSRDYYKLAVHAPEAVAFFKHFTNQE